jgi:nicotinate-nucleotide adenylyltransferase
MKIAILGGRFDPPHTGHFLIAQQTLDFYTYIDKVVFVPVYKHAWSPIKASAQDRISMLQSSLQSRMEVSDIEVSRKKISYTIDTIKAIKETTSADIYWIVGSDILQEFNKWKNHDELVKIVKFIVFPRDPHVLPKKIPQGFEVIKSPKLLTTNFSSSIIRERVKQGKSIKYLVPEAVEEYIYSHNLYE